MLPRTSAMARSRSRRASPAGCLASSSIILVICSTTAAPSGAASPTKIFVAGKASSLFAISSMFA